MDAYCAVHLIQQRRLLIPPLSPCGSAGAGDAAGVGHRSDHAGRSPGLRGRRLVLRLPLDEKENSKWVSHMHTCMLTGTRALSFSLTPSLAHSHSLFSVFTAVLSVYWAEGSPRRGSYVNLKFEPIDGGPAPLAKLYSVLSAGPLARSASSLSVLVPQASDCL